MKISVSSVIRSGTVAAAVAGLLLLISLTPIGDGFIATLLLIGILIVPFAAGLYYGYLAPGHENMLQAAIGGALSGLFGGIIIGIAFGLNAFMLGAVWTGLLGYSVAASLGTTILFGALLGALGAILGAIGGVLWPAIQDGFNDDSADSTSSGM